MSTLRRYLKSKSNKIYIICCLFIIFLYLLTKNSNISMYELVADPNEVGQLAPYTGLVSTIGTLIFAATASTCFFTAYIVGIEPKARRWQIFLHFSGWFILLLLVDDLWQIHENIPVVLFGDLAKGAIQNIGEAVVFCFYGFLFFLYAFKFKTIIWQTRLIPLLIAILFFAASTIIDIFLTNVNGHFVLEEGFKLLGIVSFSMYYFEVCEKQIEQLLNIRNKQL